jgi:hypothetical protein
MSVLRKSAIACLGTKIYREFVNTLCFEMCTMSSSLLYMYVYVQEQQQQQSAQPSLK